jgi:hypothetical protein
MSQFEAPADSHYASAAPPRTSGIAVASLVSSLIFCCPITTILGVLLGLVALVSIGGNPARKGKGLAIAGIVLGIIFTAGQAYFANTAWKAYGIFRDAPGEALRPGFAGDYAAMRRNFGPAGEQATDAEAQAFVEELRARYGSVQRSELDFQAYRGMQPQPGQTVVELPWALVFDQERVMANLTMDQSQQSGDDRIIFSRIEVIDPDRGNLVFPPAAAPPAEDVDDADTAPGE